MLTAQKPNEDPSHVGKDSYDDQGDDPGTPYIGGLGVEGNPSHRSHAKEGSIIWEGKGKKYIAKCLILQTTDVITKAAQDGKETTWGVTSTATRE